MAVIGGGYAGLSAARCLKLADPALDIAVIEREYIGSGASGRNAGILSPFLPVSWLIDCTSSSGRLEDIRFAAEYIRGEIQALADLVRTEAVNCDFHPQEILTTGAGRMRGHLLALLGERILLAGLPGRPASPEDFVAAAPPGPARAGYVLDGWGLQPLALARGLALHSQRLGIAIREQTRVTEIRQAADGLDVATASGFKVRARKVILRK